MLKSKKLQDLNDYLDRLSSSYISDYETVKDLVDSIVTTDSNRAHLDWCMVHLQTDMVGLHKTINNVLSRLREIDAGTKV